MKRMEKDTTVTAEHSTETEVASTASVEAELLVEEISIDGMCGVY
jgi:mycofactocin precursor